MRLRIIKQKILLLSFCMIAKDIHRKYRKTTKLSYLYTRASIKHGRMEQPESHNGHNHMPQICGPTDSTLVPSMLMFLKNSKINRNYKVAYETKKQRETVLKQRLISRKKPASVVLFYCQDFINAIHGRLIVFHLIGTL